MLFISMTEFLAFLLILCLTLFHPLFLLLLCIRINFTPVKPIVAGSLLPMVLHIKKLKCGEDTRRFPVAAETNYHRLVGLRQHTLFSFSSGGQKSNISFGGENQGAGRVEIPREPLREKTFLCFSSF